MDCARRAAAQQWPQLVKDAGYDLNDRRNNILAAVGTGTHSGAKYQLDEKITTGQAGPLKKSVECAINSLHDEMADGIEYDAGTPTIRAAEMQVRQLVDLYRKRVAVNIMPLETEAAIQVKHEGVLITAHIDVLTEEPAGCGVTDTKTGAKIKSHHAQVGGYSVMLRTARGANVTRLGIDFLSRNKALEYVHLDYDRRICEKLAWATIVRIVNNLHAFERTGDALCFPQNPGSMLCSVKYCRAYGTRFCGLTGGNW